jgi:NitT/TauT family transport system substrate-binding protein
LKRQSRQKPAFNAEEATMAKLNYEMTRRHYLAAAGALLAAGMGRPAQAQALATIRQGFQTNIWGMPTYYLMRSGLLEKRGIKFEEFAVPSGNLTMQQMVARQVDLGTYAGPSLIIGHARGGMVGLAVIEHVGKSIQVMARKDLGLTKVEQLRGLKIAIQVGSSVSNIFVDQIAPGAGLKKSDWLEVRMNAPDMVAAMSAKVIDAMVQVEPYNAIAEDEGIANTIVNYEKIDNLPVFMAATPEFIDKHPETAIAYLRVWLDAARDFKEKPEKVAEAVYAYYTSKGYALSKPTMQKAMATIDVSVGFSTDLQTYMHRHAEILLKEKKITALPDWSKMVRTDLLEKARAMT